MDGIRLDKKRKSPHKTTVTDRWLLPVSTRTSPLNRQSASIIVGICFYATVSLLFSSIGHFFGWLLRTCGSVILQHNKKEVSRRTRNSGSRTNTTTKQSTTSHLALLNQSIYKVTVSQNPFQVGWCVLWRRVAIVVVITGNEKACAKSAPTQFCKNWELRHQVLSGPQCCGHEKRDTNDFRSPKTLSFRRIIIQKSNFLCKIRPLWPISVRKELFRRRFQF